MKRVIFLLLLIPLFFACGGGETSSESSSSEPKSLKLNGERCSMDADCMSNYCSADNKCSDSPAPEPVCTIGQKKADGNIILACDSSGQWFEDVDCSQMGMVAGFDVDGKIACISNLP